EFGDPRLHTHCAERMEIAVAGLGPVFERDAEFEGGAAGSHESALIDSQQVVKAASRRDSRFTDSHRSDRIALYQRHVNKAAKLAGDGSGRNPGGRTATCYDHTYGCRRHLWSFLVTRARSIREVVSSIDASGP